MTSEGEDRQESIVESAVFATVGNYIEYFSGLVVSVVIARSLGPDQYGIYVFAIWLSGLAVLIVNAGVSLAAIHNIAFYDRKNAYSIANHLARIQGKDIAILLLPLLLISLLAVDWPDTLSRWIGAVSVCVGFATKAVQMLRVSMLKGLQRFRAIAILASVIAPIQFVFVLALWYLNATLGHFLVQYMVMSILFAAASTYLVRKSVQGDWEPLLEADKVSIRRQAQKLRPAGVIGFIGAPQAGILFLNYLSTPNVTSFYSIGVTLAATLSGLVPGIVNMVLLPVMSKSAASADRGAAVIRDSSRYVLHLSLIILVPSILFGDLLIEVLYGEEYVEVQSVFRTVMAAFLASQFAQVLHANLVARRQEDTVLKLFFITFAISTVGFLTLIPLWDLMGAVLAVIITISFSVCARIFLIVRDVAPGWQYSVYLKSILVAAVGLVLGLLPIALTGIRILDATLVSASYVLFYLGGTYLFSCHSETDISNVRKAFVRR